MHKTAYERRMSYWSSDVCSSDLPVRPWLDDREVPCCASLQRPTASTRHHPAVFWAHFYQGRKNAPKATARRWRDLSSLDRKSVASGQRVSVGVDLGGTRSIKK